MLANRQPLYRLGLARVIGHTLRADSLENTA